MELADAINHLKESLSDPTHKWGCEECKQEHEQLLVWLEDYKRLKDEMIPAYDEQLTEAQRKVVQQIREMKQLKEDYADLDNRLRTANTENDELKRMLMLAVEDFETAMLEGDCKVCEWEHCGYGDICKWRHIDEAMKLLGGAENAEN